ncbi:MAG: hypothetical protein LBI96_00320 [Odoribacteraceae bacterium]|nr:hypothetical protein [Odoribacteraceae bacterium]
MYLLRLVRGRLSSGRHEGSVITPARTGKATRQRVAFFVPPGGRIAPGRGRIAPGDGSRTRGDRGSDHGRERILPGDGSRARGNGSSDRGRA